jgi:hypothetical protein
MPNKKYERGYALEAKLVKFLTEENKWPFVRRTPGSKSPCDVFGITPNGVAVMFQCKSTEKDSFDLTSLFNSASVFKLKKMPEGVRKIVLIKIGFKHTSEYYMYEWINYKDEWVKYEDFTLNKSKG